MYVYDSYTHSINQGWAWPIVAWPGGVEMDFLEV